MATIQPIVIFPFGYSNGVAFEGKNAAEFLKLLSTATVVVQTSKYGSYDWYPAEPEDDIRPDIRILTTPFPVVEEGRMFAARLKEAEDKLNKHADMIAAAEALEGGDES